MTLAVKLQLSGLDEALKEAKKKGKIAVKAFTGAVYQQAQLVMLTSITLTPENTGHLKRTAYVGVPKGRNKTVELGYGASYALRVHESTSRRFRVGQSKFLTTAMNRHRRSIVAEVRANASKRFKRKDTSRPKGLFPTRPRSRK